MKNAMVKKDIEAVFKAKNVFSSRFFLVRWRRNERALCRVGFAFSRSSGNAILRNRFKRKLRELIRTTSTCRGLDLLFLSRKPLSQISEETWRQEASFLTRFCEKTC